MPRPMILSLNGWYPSSPGSCAKEIEKLIDKKLDVDIIPISAVVPHAGWYFCGRWAVNCIRILKEKTENVKNVFIFGGHLSQKDLPVLETFDFAETPFGELRNNREVITFLKKNEEIEIANFIQDNTIEVLLPIVKYFFPEVAISAIYLPPNTYTLEFAENLYDNFGANSVFIGSTDLTHYGPNYGFYHDDKKMTAIDWVKNINDKQFIELLLKMKLEESLEHALKNRSACSSGAALGAAMAAKKAGKTEGKLLGYSTSYDIRKDESFVGYSGILF